MKLSMVRILAALGCAMVSMRAAPNSFGQPPADPFQAVFEKLSGRELVERLQDDKTRSRAFYELRRRSFEDTVVQYMINNEVVVKIVRPSDDGYEIFLQSFYGAKVTLVSPPGGGPPLSLVTYSGRGGFSLSLSPEEGKYRVPRCEELFAPIAEPPQREADDSDREVLVFNEEGKMLSLFSGSEFSSQTFADVTGDGLLDHIEAENGSLEGADSLWIRTLKVVTVEEKPRTLLHLLLNWNADDWTHRVRDTDGDGNSEIEIGPRTKTGIKPKVVFRWDRRTGKFVSSKLGKSDHFRLLPADWDLAQAAFKKFRKAGLRFSATPGAVSENDAFEHGSATNRSDPEEAFPNQLPENFWRLDPKAAALAFAAVNRAEEHRLRFRLAVEDRDGAAPPQDGSVMISEHTQGCFGAHDAAWFLRIDPEFSYLASGRGLGRRAKELELKRLPYDQARQVGAVLWWLDRIRTHPEDLWPQMGMSTTSRCWRLSMRDAIGILALGRAESGSLPGWRGAFTRKVYLEYAVWLLVHAFLPPGRPAWAADRPPWLTPTPDDHPSFETARQFLVWWTPAENEISHDLTTVAAQIVSGTQDAEILELLRKIAAQLPLPTEAVAAESSVSTEMKATYAEKREARMAFFPRAAPAEYPALEERFATAYEKDADGWFRLGVSHAIVALRKAVDAALAESSLHAERAKGRSK